MKRKLLLLGFIAITFISYGQIHVKGIHFADVNYQRTFEGSGAEIGYGYFITNKFFFNAKLTHEYGIKGLTDFTLSGLRVQPALTVLNPIKKYYISPYLNIFIGLEKLNCNELNTLQEKKVYHLGVGILQEYYISQIFAFNLFVQQDITGNSNLGKTFFSYGVGMKIIFNNFHQSNSMLLNR